MPTHETEAPAEDLLEYTKNIRKKIIESTCFNSETGDVVIPADPSSLKMLSESLTALERVELTKMKIVKSAEIANGLGSIALELSRFVSENQNVFYPSGAAARVPEIDHELLDGFTISDDEISTGDSSLTYQEFKEKHSL